MSMKSAERSLQQQQDSEVDNIHDFSLRPLNSQAAKSKCVTVKFKPQKTQSQMVSTMPSLIRSEDCFKPLFQSPYVHNLLSVNGNISDNYTELKSSPVVTPLSQRSSQGKAQLVKPKPTSTYCQICRERFEDYLDVDLYLIKHIKHKVHQKKLRENPFQKYLQSLVQTYKEKGKRDKPSSSGSVEESNFIKPKKKLKTQTIQANFSIQNVNSTESTTNSSAVHYQVEKRQTMDALKE